MTSVKELYEIGEAPPLGVVPPKMHAQVIRQSRFGPPEKAFVREVVDVPPLGPNDVLVYVMAAGVNYNSVFASLGVPVDVVRLHRQIGQAGDETGFHIGGSDGAGIVYAVGENVTSPKVGDEVVMHCGVWDKSDPEVQGGLDPVLSNGFRIWGFETNWGSFAQFARVQAHQCLPRPPHLGWAEAGVYLLDAATAYRMLAGWPPHVVREGDVVLVWGGSGGLGSMGIQVTRVLGGVPIAVVSSDGRGEYCMRLGAKGYINRRQFDHWGRLPDWTDEAAMMKSILGFRAFGKAIWDILGRRTSPRIVFEHPGQDTMPTSMFVCDTAGMVVICAGTSGYNADLDLRYLWTRQKRLQGSHFANQEQCIAANQLVMERKIDPCLGELFSFDDVGRAHQLMHENQHPNGNMGILVGASNRGG